MRYRLLLELRRPIRANGCLLLDYLGPAIACNCASAETSATLPLTMKEAVQLAMQQDPQRLARLVGSESLSDSHLVRRVCGDAGACGVRHVAR